MREASSGLIPPGWYPDPSGEAQWRVWNGTTWTSLTRPYDAGGPPTSLVASLPLLAALRRVERTGVAAAYAGLGLGVGALAHWPGAAHPTSSSVATLTLGLALGLVTYATASFAWCARALKGRWNLLAVLPVVNVLYVSNLIERRLGRKSPTYVSFLQVLALVVFAAQDAQSWVVTIFPALLALELARGAARLQKQLLDPVTVAPAGS